MGWSDEEEEEEEDDTFNLDLDEEDEDAPLSGRNNNPVFIPCTPDCQCQPELCFNRMARGVRVPI